MPAKTFEWGAQITPKCSRFNDMTSLSIACAILPCVNGLSKRLCMPFSFNGFKDSEEGSDAGACLRKCSRAEYCRLALRVLIRETKPSHPISFCSLSYE